MARIKLTKSAVDAAKPQAQAIELRTPWCPASCARSPRPAARCSCSSTGRTPASAASRPDQYGELTVEQARVMAQEWLAEVRRGGDPSAAKAAARHRP